MTKLFFASHPGQASALLDDTDSLKNILGKIQYSTHTVVMHKDASHMLSNSKYWSSWTYRQMSAGKVELTYYMNRLQHIDPAFPIFVTLDPASPIATEDVFYTTTYEHPIFSVETEKLKQQISEIQGRGHFWFCGAWLGYGFHEDGLRSAVDVARKLGVKAPWDAAR